MGDVVEFDAADVRLMQGLAQQVAALRPEWINNEATVGELAWVYGMDFARQGDTWRRELWFDGGELAAWGWAFLPCSTRSGRPIWRGRSTRTGRNCSTR